MSQAFRMTFKHPLLLNVLRSGQHRQHNGPIFRRQGHNDNVSAYSREMASVDELEVSEFESEKEIAAAPIVEDSGREIENNGVNDVESDKSEHLARLPISRVRHIMKLDPDVNMATQEAVYLVCKATELFIESLARESCSFTVQSKKKTIQRRDIDSSIGAVEALSFLDGALD